MGDRTVKRLSPINVIEERHWDEDMPIRIAGVASLDYMRLHKKYSFKDEPSYKLDALGEKYVDQKKIEYEVVFVDHCTCWCRCRRRREVVSVLFFFLR